MSATEHTGADNGTIRFLLDDNVHEVTDVAPTTTVLNYLREYLQRTGTKEGCAEGDCGACTVVVAEPDTQGVRFRSINSCIQFLPTLNGKALYTVESLKKISNGGLHPVQQAMVDCHGSQCGFCTPGFVMSLFALYRNSAAPTRDEIDDALSGNLCRCTGYQPIIRAARRMYDYGQDLVDEAELGRRLDKIRPGESLELSVENSSRVEVRDRYFAPAGLSELADLLVRHPGATILAGGTDIGLWFTKEYRDLPVIIYIGQVGDLDYIDETADRLEIGAAVSLTDAFAVLDKYYPDLFEIMRRFASPPIRNAGTLCGNIANGSPIGDTMPALISLGAVLVLRRGSQVRELPLDEFYPGYRETALQESEFVQAVQVPLRRGAGVHFRSYKIAKRYDQDISAVCGAYYLRLESGVVADARICYGGMAAVPQRARQCEDSLRGRHWDQATVEAAIKAMVEDYQPLTDMRATSGYRRRVAGNLLKRFYLETTGVETSVWAQHG
ncbi:MAG: xanthine dehydrogenase small subunit [Gammaproteobacteria bacterium]|nr:xanthine dehydrogenase small subunit [Gammaproteobacteria bacterium]